VTLQASRSTLGSESGPNLWALSHSSSASSQSFGCDDEAGGAIKTAIVFWSFVFGSGSEHVLFLEGSGQWHV